MLPASTSILDDYFFIQREVLAWKYLATTCKQENGTIACPLKQNAQLGTLNPHAQASAPVSLQFPAEKKSLLRGTEHEIIRLDVKSEIRRLDFVAGRPIEVATHSRSRLTIPKSFETRWALPLTDARTARVLTTVLLFALALGFLYIARQTLIAFLFAVFFAYLVDPAVSRTEKWTRSRGVSHGSHLSAASRVIGDHWFFFVGPKIGHQAQRLGEALPALLDQVSSGNIAVTLGQERGWSGTTIQQTQDFLDQPPQ